MTSFHWNTCHWKTWLKNNKKTAQVWGLLVLVSLAVTLLQSKKQDKTLKAHRNIDTYIPKGFVLVPVELSNSPSLDGILANKGVVDLYTGDPTRQKAEKVAEAVKIIRSPNSPAYFAVLAPAEQAVFLIQRFQAFHAVIQNPQHKKTAFIWPLRKKSSRSIVIDLDNSLDL